MKKSLIPSAVLMLLLAASFAFAQESAPQPAPQPVPPSAAPAVADNSLPKTAAVPQSDTVIEDIVARINNDIVTTSDYERSLQQLQDEMKQQYGDQAATQYAARERDALRDLIDQDLLVQKGKDLGISVENDLIKRLDDIRKKMNLETMDDLEKAAQAQGVSYEDFKNNLRNQLITQEVISREVGSHIQITPQEEQAFYDQHKAELERPEQVRLSEILVGIPQTSSEPTAMPDPQVVAAAQSKAEDIEKQLQAGAKFDELARKDSDGPTAQQGGDLGYFKRGALAKQLEDASFSLKPGQFTQPIRTKQGFLILTVTEHQDAGLPPLKTVQNDIDQAIYYQKLQPALREYLTKLREEAYIHIKPGYVDTGAAPAPSEPSIVVTTAADQQAAKAKKKKKKFVIF